jgi:glycosyltransferase involved in cell wall biosynthesis
MHNPLSFYPEQTSDLDGNVIVAAGRYAPEKGYDRLIDAFAAVAPEHPDWSLRIFGHGPLHAELQDQVRRLGLEAQVQLPGLAEDIEAELRAGSIFALSSIHEGLPMALAEAMACGVPCVAFDCAAGVREIITDGQDGIVVQPRNVPALADALRTLMDDDDLRHRLGAAARRSVRRFTPDAIAAEWEDVFALVER